MRTGASTELVIPGHRQINVAMAYYSEDQLLALLQISDASSTGLMLLFTAQF